MKSSYWPNALICAAAITGIPPSFASGATKAGPYAPPIFVETPYQGELAQANLRKLVPADVLSDKALAASGSVRRYGYVFGVALPATDCPSQWVCPIADGNWYITRRVTSLSLDLIRDKINIALASQEQHACSTVHIGGASLAFATQSVAEFRAPISFTKRWCAGDWNGKIADGSGTAVVRVTLNQTFPTYSDDKNLGHVEFNTSADLINIDADIFDLFDINSVVGQLFVGIGGWLGTLLFGDSISGEIDDALDQIRSSDFARYAVQAASNVKNLRQLSALLNSQEFGAKLSYLAPLETGFACENSGCVLQIVETQYTFKRRMKEYYAYKLCEMKTIASLKQGPRVRIVKKRETLAGIAKEEYCTPEMYQYLLFLNKNLKDGDNLRHGMRLTIEPAFKYLMLGNGIVQRGDNLWRRWKNSSAGLSWPEYRRSLPGSDDVDEIFPLQIDLPR